MKTTPDTVQEFINTEDPVLPTPPDLTAEVFHHALDNWRINAIAIIAHEINAAFCRRHQDYSQPQWKDAPDWQKQSALSGVSAHLKETLTPEQSHVLWYNQKAKEGWVYGPEKNIDKKTHPCMVSYQELPIKQRAKDVLFSSVVRNLNLVYSPNAPICLQQDAVMRCALSITNDYLEFIKRPLFNESYFLRTDVVKEFNEIHNDIIRREIRNRIPEEIIPHLNGNVKAFESLEPDDMMFMYIFIAIASKTWTIESLIAAQEQLKVVNAVQTPVTE